MEDRSQACSTQPIPLKTHRISAEEAPVGPINDATLSTVAVLNKDIENNASTKSLAAHRDPDFTPMNKSDDEIAADYIVGWDGPDDPTNPANWSYIRKWITVALVTTITFVASVASTISAPGVPLLMNEFHYKSIELASFIVSIYIIGFCIGPLILAPLSELYGRSVLIHGSNVFLAIFCIACAVSSNLPMFIVFRFLMGIAGCPPLAVGGGTIADIIPARKRGRALSIWGMGPVLGPVIGPIIGGYLAQKAGWRWIFWLLAIILGVLTTISLIFLRETHAPTVLKRKVQYLRKKTGNPEIKSVLDNGQSPSTLFKTAIIRPTKMIIFSPIVLILALHTSTYYSYTYLLFTTFTPVFEDQYNFSTGEAGLAYLGIGIGFVVGILAVGFFSDRYAQKKSAEGPLKPEYRLPPLVIGAFFVPVGLVWYGWSAEYQVHWIVPIIGTAFFGFGGTLAFLPIQMYLVDAFTIYAASAIATNTVVRSLFGATLPLAGRQLYVSLGYGWGNSLLGFIALAFVPVPFLLIKYGERLRTDPRFQPKL